LPDFQTSRLFNIQKFKVCRLPDFHFAFEPYQGLSTPSLVVCYFSSYLLHFDTLFLMTYLMTPPHAPATVVFPTSLHLKCCTNIFLSSGGSASALWRASTAALAYLAWEPFKQKLATAYVAC
jgi:hypothetical protein